MLCVVWHIAQGLQDQVKALLAEQQRLVDHLAHRDVKVRFDQTSIGMRGAGWTEAACGAQLVP